MQQNGESIYGTRGNIISPQQWGVATAKDKKIYLHILNRPAGEYIFVPGIVQKIIGASPLSKVNVKLNFKQQSEGVFIYINELPKDAIDTIIQLDVQ
jgi:alpha-L-fucosidase